MELPAKLTGSQYIEMVASIKRCAPNDFPIDDFLANLSLMEWLPQSIGTYSYGTKIKVSIAAALLGSPSLIMLDESLNGLDPIVSWKFKRLLCRLADSAKAAIILSTHMLETVAAICNSAVLLAGGHVAKTWDAMELQASKQLPGGFEDSVIDILQRTQQQVSHP